MILLDTHVLIWLAEGARRIGGSALQRLRDEGAGVVVSAVTYWEIGLLVGDGHLSLSSPVRDWFARVLDEGGFSTMGIDPDAALDAATLPGSPHRDPMDRLLVGVARTLGSPLMTADRKILAYAAAGHVQAIDARR